MFSNILVAVDGSESAAQAFETALQFASDTGARLHPLFIIDLPVMLPEVPGVNAAAMREALRQDGERLMKHCVGTMARHGVQGTPEIDDLVRPEEDVAHRIEVAAAKLEADVIVIGTHGRRGPGYAPLGSVAEQILRSTTRPVLAIPARRTAPASAEQTGGAVTTHSDTGQSQS
ncbi:nucleotide-binding universal stress UspA family protein [Paraburkholderia atlantica]|uniref:universal stress protein n=1 Tax=Paraburkholderia atlantica TaxID=2654982 RepID=UPI0015927D06|nr:universal stress protein [Paraburkholderia atlantica]MBB5415337.1 nucleotide-binding universal stress UspA family protein [Paraburkholderia atlantica]NUY31084.1 universal stress protein [Paraburkholderia atlantica]